jgi:hypothetical protein
MRLRFGYPFRSVPRLLTSPSARSSSRCRRKLLLETLEDRTSPAILFHPGTTATVSDDGGRVLDHVHAELIFWGSGWTNNVTLQANVNSGVDSILAGPYMSALSQFRSSIGPGSHTGTATITSSSPPAVFTRTDVLNMLGANINAGTLPNPANDSQLLYVVITQPGSSAGSRRGEHGLSYSTHGPYHYVWTADDGSLDFLTTVFSHELVESATDPEGTAIQVNPRDSTNWNEIGDGEAQNYTYRLNNFVVQSYLSPRDHAYIVPTGHTQNFLVSTSGILTVNGDQLANPNDTIAIDRTAASGVMVNLNGESVQFDPNAIRGVVVAGGAGTDTTNVEKTIAAAPVTLDLGNDNDTVNVSPAARNLGNIQGSLTVNGGPGADTLTIHDDAANDNISYTLNGSTLARNGAASISYSSIQQVIIDGGAGDNSYTVLNTATESTTMLKIGGGTDTATVQATTGPLTVVGQGGNRNDMISVGNSGSVQAIHGAVAVMNPPNLNHVVVDDSADTIARTFTHDSFSPSGDGEYGRIIGLAPAPITYRYGDTRDITIRTGRGGAMGNILSTGVIMTLAGDSSAVNTLIGSNAPNMWTITDVNSGTLTSAALSGRVTFYSFQNLTGGPDDDTFAIRSGGSVAGTIDGGDGVNTLDYSTFYGNVEVNLQMSSATNVGGGVQRIQDVRGTSGPGYNILVGNGGNILIGGSGARNLLIAGGSESSLQAGENQDILIGGTTDYDTDPNALRAIMNEWTRTDEDYFTRVTNVAFGIGVPALNQYTVTGNGGGNTLLGGADLSWFFGDPANDAITYDPTTEVLMPI